MSKTKRIKRSLRKFTIFGCAIAPLLFSALARGEPVTTIRAHGESANRVDLVILGDGYTSTEMDKYAMDVEDAVQGFFAQEPFKEYQRYFNVHRVDVKSAESGVDHPEKDPPVSKATALDGTYSCAGIQRLICVDLSKVEEVLGNSVGLDQRDIVLVLVNDAEYGGSGGSIAVASRNPSGIELVLHEIGHSFGLLADEYEDQPPSCDNTFEPAEANVTRETERGLIKWNAGGGFPAGWIDPSTPVPTTSTAPGIPGLYEGAKYCPFGLFRPTFNSKMRYLGVPFEQVNEEQLVKRIYNWVSPIDSVKPPASALTLELGASQAFEIVVPTTETHALSVTWYVDDSPVANDLTFTFDSARFGPGQHAVQVMVKDSTPKVRNDPANVLRDARAWNVKVNANASVPNCFGVPATIVGTDENEVLTGTSGDDVIVGLGGNDVIDGRSGNDRLCGGDGNDVIMGRTGNDFLDGGSGLDTLIGNRGINVCINGETTLDCRGKFR